MSEMISDMFNQLRRRTITASSRRLTAASRSDKGHRQYFTSPPGDGGCGGGSVVGEGESVIGGGAVRLFSNLPMSSEDPHSVSSKRSRLSPSGNSNNSFENVSCRNVSSSKSSKTKVPSSNRSNSNSSRAKNPSSFKSVHGFNLVSVIFAQTLILMCSMCCSSKVYNVHWNTSNPIFRIDNTDHIIDVNRDSLPYDQVNIICPVYAPGTKEEDAEKYIIYNVSKEEYDTCRITNPNPRIIAVCDKPYKLMYFTITFRSFTPQPGGLEFRPGQDYYFISTSSRDDLHRRVGGRCSTHNMKVVFKVCCHPGETSSQSTTSAPALPQIPRFSTPRASTASSGTLSPRRTLIVYNSSSSIPSASNPNIGRFNGSSFINDHTFLRTDSPFYGNGLGNGGSSSSPASTSTTNLPTPHYPAAPPVTRYPPKKTQYSSNPNYKPPSKKKELEKHPNEVVKNEELTSGASSTMMGGGGHGKRTTAMTLLLLVLTTTLLTTRIQSPSSFHWCVR